jgi:hypothetical protein
MMKKHIRSEWFRLVYAGTVSFLMVTLCVLALTPAVLFANDTHERGSVANRTHKFFIFNLAPTSTYDVTKNFNPVTTKTASLAGGIRFTQVLNTGDQIVVIKDAVAPVPPSAPTGLTAAGNDVGCADLDWNANPEGDVVGYRIYFGRLSVESGQAGEYDDSLNVGFITDYTVCGLIDGDYYFALRARNAAGMFSPYSAEAPTTVTTGSAQGPLPPQHVTVSSAVKGCATVSWDPGPEPDLAGYEVFYGPLSVAQGQAVVYENSTDVGNTTSVDVCDLPEGTFYFAVRAYNTNGDASAYSTEKSLQLGATEGPAAAPSVSIVPDGYWVGDPSRPLEVHNLPLGWTVRIFDTAGSEVKSFTNTFSDGYDWSWDFCNNHGRFVAKTLYLVRITNDGGQVMGKGRFLVQDGR